MAEGEQNPAEAGSAEGGGASAGAASSPKKNLRLIVLGVNFVALLGAVGTLVYTKLIYEHPAITETQEMEKKKEEAKKPPPSAERVVVNLEEIRINVASPSNQSHFVSFGMAIECANDEMAGKVKGQLAQLTDKVIATFNRKQFDELNTIQGRLILKEQLIHEFNQMLDAPAVTDVFYTNFVLQ